MKVRADTLIGRFVVALRARPLGPPWLRVTAPPWLAGLLVALGARRAGAAEGHEADGEKV